MRTLALDNENWDLMVDDYGNLAIKEDAECLAQDVASSVRVWSGELPFDTTRGVDYDKPDENRQTLKMQMLEQIGYIEGVGDAFIDFSDFKDRKLVPMIYLTTENGEKIVVGEENVRPN